MTPYWSDSTTDIYHGDALTVLRELPPQSVNCVVTSPPYWGLRDYGVEGQLGLERTPEEYVARLVGLFANVRRVLEDNGTLWLNLGDSYAGSWGNYGGKNRGSGTQREILMGSRVHNQAYDGLEETRPPASWTKETGLKPKDLIGIPWRVALALQADGWWLRSDIIWSKPNPMPESVTDRPTKAHEYIFLLAKSERYHYDYAAILEEGSGQSGGACFGKVDQDGPGSRRLSKEENARIRGHRRPHKGFNERWDGMTKEEQCATRNKRSVWTVAVNSYKPAHFATFPPDLIKPCILAGCPVGGKVLDPFLGSGTTAQVARQCGCKCVGIELNESYIKLAMKRLRQKVLMFDSGDSEPVRTRIAE